jgi:SAM-dependent methyltransferase
MISKFAILGTLIQQLLGAIPLKSRYCCVCKNYIFRFIPYRGWCKLPPLMTALRVIGSDVKQFGCPRCGSHDRERHLILFFEKLGIFDKMVQASIIHFAPETNLSKRIEACLPEKYVKCDLYPTVSGIEKINIISIPYESKRFDFVIANHVLEHVIDDMTALSELHRVCKIGGLAILQTPYSIKLLATLSDPGIDSDLSRLQIYGQEDHVRLYGSDIFSRFESVGFKANVLRHEDILSDVDSTFFGVNANEPLFLFERIS